MTVEMCAAFCQSYAWFGVEYGTQCYCGPYPRSGAGLTPVQSDCNFLCPGNNLEYCGAGNRLNTYLSLDSAKISADPASPATVGNYTFSNCVVDSPRMLINEIAASDSMTVETCVGLAQAGGYAWAGLEYGRECWVGNSLLSPISVAAATDCNMACKGSGKELCGGSSRMSLYSKTT
jgi:hypothetical protein